MQSTEGSDPDGVTARQGLLVGLCALGLLVAAFAMPAAAPRPGPPALDFWNQESDCVILLSEEPAPGQPVTATIRYQEEPVQDSPVWFNGESVGRTDENGRVVGTVPYERQLQISVELPSGGRCRATSSTGGGVSVPESGAQSSLATGSVGTTATARPFGAVGESQIGVRAQQQQSNGTGSYPVRGRIDISVAGQPYPGENTTIRATIRGNPVPDAVVEVDGQRVARTDEGGRAQISAPEEGDGTLRVAVSRGDFRSVRQVVVLRLTASVQPASMLPLPGQDATVVARLGDRPATDATVTVDGESIGETDDDGTVPMTLPIDPTTVVTVEAADQTATSLAVLAFAPTVLFALLFAGVTFGIPAAGYAHSGRRGLVGGLLTVAAVYALAAGYLVAGGTGLLAVVALIVISVVLVAFVRSDHDATSSVSALGTNVGRLGNRLFSDTLWLTGRIESVIDGLESRLQTMWDRLLSSSLSDAGGWITGLPGRLVSLVRALLSTPRRLFDRSDEPDEASESRTTKRSTDESRTPRARFRELWRRFARRVVRSEWPRRTAGEVSRRAIDRGMPAEPVEELTDTFRAVEYGDQSLTEREVERANAALSAILDDEEGSK